MILNFLVTRVNTCHLFARVAFQVEVLQTVSEEVEKFINTILWSNAQDVANIGSRVRNVIGGLNGPL